MTYHVHLTVPKVDSDPCQFLTDVDSGQFNLVLKFLDVVSTLDEPILICNPKVIDLGVLELIDANPLY